MKSSYRITFITPLFSKGVYDDKPEIRAPSIRGQLHWWFRALGGSWEDENFVFGSVHSRPSQASKVVIRVAEISEKKGNYNPLPHKRFEGRAAYGPETAFTLQISERLGGLEGNRKEAFLRALKGWLLAGTLGMRATRASGSFLWEGLDDDTFPMPTDGDAYKRACDEIFSQSLIKYFLLPASYQSADEARWVVSDTIGGGQSRDGSNDLNELKYPLGSIRPPRKTSPLRFRIIRLGSSYKIVAVWDGRDVVTGNTYYDFKGVVCLLERKKKQIGIQLAKVIEGQ